MTDLFFYGTLCHVPLLELVLGRPAAQIDIAASVLPDHAAFWVAGHSFPMIVSTPGAVTPGLLVRGLSERDIARLDFYEGGFEYRLRDVAVKVGDVMATAQVYFPAPGLWQPAAPWDLADWASRWGQITVTAARDMVVQFGRRPAEQMRALWPFFCARAWAQQLAATPAPQTVRSQMTVADVEILAEKPGFDGFFRLRAFDLRHRRFDGDMGEPVGRESFVAFDAALVLPYDPVNDSVLLIEQMRYGPLMRGDPAPWVLEPIAGLVDAGENPADCARREAVEEAGIALGDLRPMVRIYASPGYTTEYFHCFMGLCDLSGRGTQLGGLANENEDIRSHVIPFAQAMALVDSGEINVGPLVMMLLWLARERESLRAAG
ncbi:gamma-glutamylcyclotransferase [Puniceibacterium sp. IMCC21224]|uniref:gamma-glutamylcyclotransferase n=1 Tax=Puniceibacterium sp. IMCC21224 TaxID=1618204 RepID=UPI00064DA68B|nr:gamma-glutamylcyclotransferase [Puniceibacterium sp. IMCC21224]KMK67540.1 protein containing C-terminal region of TrgB protein [Puniceibacterium sp. IMCC21224]